jgi:hypothetical protein
VTVENGVQSIEGGAFSSCKHLANFVIPESVKNLGGWAFFACVNLRSVAIRGTLESIGEWTFSGCANLREVNIPCGVKYIGTDAFWECVNLREIVVPETTASIGRRVFGGCRGLKRAVLPESLAEIGEHAFFNCIDLTRINVPNHLEAIPSQAFFGCESLTEIALPDSIKTIGERAFAHCANLRRCTIADTAEEIGANLFLGCGNLADEEGFVILDGVLYGYYGSEPDCAVAGGVRKIASGAFEGSRIHTLTLPESVRAIGKNALKDTENLSVITAPGVNFDAFETQKDRLSAVVGFCGAFEEFAHETSRQYEVFIADNLAEIVKMAIDREYPAVIAYVTKKRMLAYGDYLSALESAQEMEHNEISAMLLDYKNNVLTSQNLFALLSLEDSK